MLGAMLCGLIQAGDEQESRKGQSQEQARARVAQLFPHVNIEAASIFSRVPERI
jgi:uncharacterized protein YhbP (UPF0306 family)